MPDSVRGIVTARATDPGVVARQLSARRRARPLAERERVFLVAADHPARGVLKAGSDPLAMADRGELLRRLKLALSRPGVDGVLASADIVDDLAIGGALDEKLVFGTMNRGGLAGSVFEIDDAFTGYTAARLAAAGLDGGKMMIRVCDDDPGTLRTLVACARAIDELAALRLPAMIEVFATRRDGGGLVNDLSTAAMQRAIAIASGLGGDSSWTWLKLPVTDDTREMLAATTLPVVLLGGDPGKDAAATFARWQEAMTLPQSRGLVAGRALLYPEDGDVAGAVDRAAAVVRG
ncbi:MAG TPA: deoxyribose-phosphate aldolase [Candidatus Saccharimonadales bacterium]|nr:deoxyribose-phosphate aldolase [Candidatus Saccharimonadales bacterium]